MDSLGKLKRTLKDKCGECGKNLQERTRIASELIRGEVYSHDESYAYCPYCETEFVMKSKRRKVIVEKIWDGKI